MAFKFAQRQVADPAAQQNFEQLEPHIEPPVVAALPDNPRDGQVVDFQTQAMWDAGVQPMRLRYQGTQPNGDPNTNTAKWIALGGGEMHGTDGVGAEILTGSNVYTAVITLPALPLSGLWRFDLGADLLSANTVGAIVAAYLYLDGVSHIGVRKAGESTQLANYVSTAKQYETSALAGTVPSLRIGRESSAYRAFAYAKYLTVTPVAVY